MSLDRSNPNAVRSTLDLAYTAKTANYTVLVTDYLIDCISGIFTITLPTAVNIQGQHFVVKNSGTGTITVDGSGSETIDDITTQTLNSNDSITVVSDGVNFIII